MLEAYEDEAATIVRFWLVQMIIDRVERYYLE